MPEDAAAEVVSQSETSPETAAALAAFDEAAADAPPAVAADAADDAPADPAADAPTEGDAP